MNSIAKKLMVKMFLVMSILCIGVKVDLLYAQGAEGMSGPKGVEVGKNWIQNKTVRVELKIVPPKWYRLQYLRWNEAESKWDVFFEGHMAGTTTSKELTKSLRDKWGTYYLFQNDIPSNIRTWIEKGSAKMTFRMEREELWIDTEVTILKNSPFVLIEQKGQSREELVGQYQVYLSQKNIFIVHDHYGGEGTVEKAGKDFRDRNAHVYFQKYSFAYNLDEEKIYGFFATTPRLSKQQIMFTHAPWGSAYINPPFVLYGELLSGQKDAATVSHYAEGLYGELHNLLYGEK